MSRIKDNVKELDDLLLNPANTICKMMWFSQNRPVVCLDNATLVWLIANPVSGDLIKVCTDTSLKDVKLSGKRVSDIEFVMGAVPMMILVYVDQNRVDFIGFVKTALFEAYLNLKEANPEKLSLFEPGLIRSLELQCPSTFDVEKRLIFCSKLGI